MPTQVDRPAFFAVVDRKSQPAAGKVADAYAFYRAALARPGPDAEPLELLRVEVVLRSRLTMVSITTGPNDNVHRIFESLSNRGVRLSQADLLRNFVFMLLPTRHEKVYTGVWEPMQQQLTPTQLESLVQIDLVLDGNATVERQDLYRAQQARLRLLADDEAAVEAYVEALAARADLFRLVLDPNLEEDPAVSAALRRFKEWGSTTTAWPILVYALERRSRGTATSDDVARALRIVEAFLVRRLLVNKPTNNLNRIFSALPGQLSSELALPDDIRHALSAERRFYPSNEAVRQAVRAEAFYYHGRYDQQQFVFRRLEESFEHAEPVDWDKAALTIEHIMPQALTADWKAALRQDGDDPADTHAELLHTLGNLTVTAYNGQLSNKPFERKQQILSGSHLELNKAVAPETKWGRAEILARADDLAERCLRIWPEPDSPQISEEGKDWSLLRAALALLPHGTWTTYGDVAGLVASHPVPVGKYFFTTAGVFNAHRVLTVAGRPSGDFRWVDPNDSRDVVTVLVENGVKIDESGAADRAQRLRTEDLAALLQESEMSIEMSDPAVRADDSAK